METITLGVISGRGDVVDQQLSLFAVLLDVSTGGACSSLGGIKNGSGSGSGISLELGLSGIGGLESPGGSLFNVFCEGTSEFGSELLSWSLSLSFSRGETVDFDDLIKVSVS